MPPCERLHIYSVITVTRFDIAIESPSSKTPYASFGTIMSDRDLFRMDLFPSATRKDNPLPGDAAAFTKLRENVDGHRFGELSAQVRHRGTAKVFDLRHSVMRIRTNALRHMQQKNTYARRTAASTCMPLGVSHRMTSKVAKCFAAISFAHRWPMSDCICWRTGAWSWNSNVRGRMEP